MGSQTARQIEDGEKGGNIWIVHSTDDMVRGTGLQSEARYCIG
jgi:hypothetical protein